MLDPKGPLPPIPPKEVLSPELREKLKAILKQVGEENPEIHMFHGLYFVFGIDKDGKPVGTQEIFNSFGMDIPGMRNCLMMINNILNQYEDAEDEHAHYQTH